MSSLRLDPVRRQRLEELLKTDSAPLHVVGLGHFGGNIALIRHLVQKGRRVVLWESAPREKLLDSWAQLEDCHDGIVPHFGVKQPDPGPDETLFVSPAVQPQSPFLGGRSEIFTELELALGLLEAAGTEVHIVFGSLGKSTCAALLASLLGCEVWGNIGRSLLESACMPAEIVLEVSSFQLHYLEPTRFVPASYLMTILAANHADWHGGLEAYQGCKLRWLEYWKGRGVPGLRMKSVLEDGDCRLEGSGCVIKIGEQEERLPLRPPLMGAHNLLNLHTVSSLGHLLGRLNESGKARLGAFAGLPHRLEIVAEQGDLRFINDSKATSPGAVLSALRSVRRGPCLILQGVDKSADFGAVLEELVLQGGRLCLCGELARRWVDDLPPGLSCQRADTLDDLFENPEFPGLLNGDILLSPGAPSYDRYDNYEERGRHFSMLARGYRP
ncbi:MAG: hypothetical protein HQL31_00840 [Planctomycetes bacterium]|nr:hypothetical protein [Planctomycetota bacterium]